MSATPNKDLTSNKDAVVIINVSDCQEGKNKTDQLNPNLNTNTASASNIGSSNLVSTKDTTTNTLTTGGSFRNKGHTKSASMSCASRNETNLSRTSVQNQSNNAATELNTNTLNTANIGINETDRPRYIMFKYKLIRPN